MSEEKKASKKDATSDEDILFPQSTFDYDPLSVDDNEIDQEKMDDDNPYDTVDYPTVRNMPEDMHHGPRYTAERQGSVEKAVDELFDHNPSRKPVFLKILKWCEGGSLNSELSEKIKAAQNNNYSVYTPTMLCRMLERTGALTLTMPETSEEEEDIEDGVRYLKINKHVDPTWTTTEDGSEVYQKYMQGDEFKDIVLNRDVKYAEPYLVILNALNEAPHSKKELEDMVNDMPILQHPRRFGGHFIDMLERCAAIEWRDRSWHITDLGKSMIPAVQQKVFEMKEAELTKDQESQNAAE